ncbi:hypothetical protein [Pseudoalteromonas pernae]|uniref:hypothetical protein n=1 Tax=Pseudoalteromonas pernae TaxID=3118054 RepID=UPI003241E671
MLSKQLFHFALVQEKYAETGDIISGLLPLFTPILAGKEGQEFSPQKLCEGINEAYGLQVHPYVAEELAPKLASSGVLRINNLDRKGERYYIEKIPEVNDEALNRDIKDIFRVYETLVGKFLEKNGFKGQKLDYAAEFTSRLARLSQNKAEKGQSDDSHNTIDNILDYAFARLVSTLEEKGGRSKNALWKAYSGAILSEVVLSIKEPILSKNSISGKIFYIDAPIILNILGFNDKYSVDSSRTLIEQIIEVGGIVTTTSSYIEETKASIKISLSNREYKNPRVSSLDRFMFNNPNEVVNVRAAQRNVSEILENQYKFSLTQSLTNIARLSTSQRAHSLRERLSHELNWYKNDVARDNDTEAVTYVVAHHGFCPIQYLSESKSFLITPNESLINSSNHVLYSMSTFTKPDMTPLLTEKKLAMLLWVISGGAGKDISSLSLLSSCVSVMESHREEFYKIQEFIKNLDEDNAKLYESIITNDRAMHCLIDNVGGNYKILNEQNFEDHLAQARLDSQRQEEEREMAHFENQRRLESQLSKETIAKNKALDTVIKKSRSELESEKEKQALESELRSLKSKVAGLAELVEGQKVNHESEKLKLHEQGHVNTTSIVSNKIEALLKILFSLILVVICFKFSGLLIENDIDASFIIIKKGFANGFVSLLPLLLIWKTPEFIFGRPIKFFSNKAAKALTSK